MRRPGFQSVFQFTPKCSVGWRPGLCGGHLRLPRQTHQTVSLWLWLSHCFGLCRCHPFDTSLGGLWDHSEFIDRLICPACSWPPSYLYLTCFRQALHSLRLVHECKINLKLVNKGFYVGKEKKAFSKLSIPPNRFWLSLFFEENPEDDPTVPGPIGESVLLLDVRHWDWAPPPSLPPAAHLPTSSESLLLKLHPLVWHHPFMNFPEKDKAHSPCLQSTSRALVSRTLLTWCHYVGEAQTVY